METRAREKVKVETKGRAREKLKVGTKAREKTKVETKAREKGKVEAKGRGREKIEGMGRGIQITRAEEDTFFIGYKLNRKQWVYEFSILSTKRPSPKVLKKSLLHISI